MRVLIIEDEPKSAAYFWKGLSAYGYVTDLAGDGEDGLFNNAVAGLQISA